MKIILVKVHNFFTLTHKSLQQQKIKIDKHVKVYSKFIQTQSTILNYYTHVLMEDMVEKPKPQKKKMYTI